MIGNKSAALPYLLPGGPQMSDKELREQAERLWQTQGAMLSRLPSMEASMLVQDWLALMGYTTQQADLVFFFIEQRLRDNARPADTPPRKVGRARLFKTEDEDDQEA